MSSKIVTEAKYSGTLLIGFAISDKNDNLLFRYQRKTFTPEEDNMRSFIYPVPKFTLITGGVGEWNIKETVYQLRPGDLFILRPGCVRYFNNIDPSFPLTCEIYEFIPSFLKNMECLEIFRQEVTAHNTLIPHRNGSNLDLIELLDMLKRELHNAPDGCADMVRAYLTMLTVKAARKLGIKTGSDIISPWSATLSDHEVHTESSPFEYTSQNTPPGSHDSDHAIAMAYIMDTIRSNVSGDISIDQLANDVHMSRSHFFKVFRKHNGLSVNDFILKCRIENTVNMLLETGCNILDAAYASGFTSSSGFYKSFKKVTGMTPKEYLYNIRNNWSS